MISVSHWLLLLPALLLLNCSAAPLRTESTREKLPPEVTAPVPAPWEIPATWEVLDSIPVADLPIYPANGCWPGKSTATTFSGKAARYRFGSDTLYLEQERAVFWPYGSYAGCILAPHALSDGQRDSLAHYYDLESGASIAEKERHFYEAIPDLAGLEIGTRQFIYVNQGSRQVRGPSGIFDPGGPDRRPLNVFGYALSFEAKSEIVRWAKTALR